MLRGALDREMNQCPEASGMEEEEGAMELAPSDAPSSSHSTAPRASQRRAECRSWSLPRQLLRLVCALTLFSTVTSFNMFSFDEIEITNLMYMDPDRNCTNDTTLIHLLLNTTGYNKHKVPGGSGVKVEVEFWVQEISSISEATNDFEMDIYINELWLDPALRFDHLNPCKHNLSLSHQILERLWTPNSCFINSKVASIHDSPFRNIFLMIYPNGTVWVNYRVKVKGPCAMDLSKFPMDAQTCSLVYESFNYNSAEVAMRWNNKIPKAVYELKKIRLPDFDLVNITTAYTAQVYPAGLWDELTVTFHFQRRYMWYLLQAYIPTYLTIFISWVSFTLGAKAIPARTMLGVNALLAMIFQFGNIMRNLPRVSYVKAIDVFMLASMTMIFASLIELAIIGHMTKDLPGPADRKHSNVYVHCAKHQPLVPSRKERRTNAGSGTYTLPLTGAPAAGLRYEGLIQEPELSQKAKEEEPELSQTAKEEEPELSQKAKEQRGPLEEGGRIGCCRTCCNLFCPVWTPDMIDRASAVAFPTVFSLFNIIYWTYYSLVD